MEMREGYAYFVLGCFSWGSWKIVDLAVLFGGS